VPQCTHANAAKPRVSMWDQNFKEFEPLPCPKAWRTVLKGPQKRGSQMAPAPPSCAAARVSVSQISATPPVVKPKSQNGLSGATLPKLADWVFKTGGLKQDRFVLGTLLRCPSSRDIITLPNGTHEHRSRENFRILCNQPRTTRPRLKPAQ